MRGLLGSATLSDKAKPEKGSFSLHKRHALQYLDNFDKRQQLS
jgi:hypothetical protein